MKHNENEQFEGKPVKKRRGTLLAVFIVIVLLAAGLVVLANSIKIRIPVMPTQTVADPTAETADTTEPAMQELSVSDLLKAVLTVKDDLESAIEDMSNGDLELASLKLNGIIEKDHSIRESLGLSIQALGDSLPSLQAELANVQQVLNLVDTAVEKLMRPAVQQLGMHPLSELKSGDGINAKLLCEYLKFMESLMPDVEAVLMQANQVDLSMVDDDGDIAEYLEKGNELLELYHEEPRLFTMLRSTLGEDGDRVYVLAAQNSSEIRASGGFAGAIGTVEIHDGVMTVGDFRKVYDVFLGYTPHSANVTVQEGRLFHGGLTAPRDADYCPDFERVGEVFALGYAGRMNVDVSGVISVTPVILQRLLTAANAEITLFDGMVLNGSNATRGIQYDIYHNYFGREYVANATTVTDQLFADAAKKTAQVLTENMEAENLLAYLDVAKESFHDRTLMLWAKDPDLQSVIRKMGWSGTLNYEPEKPQAGVYFNTTVASKMGWYLRADIEMGEGTPNADGSRTYPMSVTFTNTLTTEEKYGLKQYITGNGGWFGGSAYFFAPAGGTVSDFTSDSQIYVTMDEYKGLQLGFLSNFTLGPEVSLTIRYNLTTAPGVDAVPEISQTPTLQAFH